MFGGHVRSRLPSSSRLSPGQCEPATFFFLASRDDTMSVLHMFLPACEPARSEALAQLMKTHHIPRHLVKGIARANQSEREAVNSVGASTHRQAAPPQDFQAPPALE